MKLNLVLEPEKYNTPVAILKFAAVVGIILCGGWFLSSFINHVLHHVAGKVQQL